MDNSAIMKFGKRYDFSLPLKRLEPLKLSQRCWVPIREAPMITHVTSADGTSELSEESLEISAADTPSLKLT